MFNCDKCDVLCTRRLRFVACNHALCANCVADLIWDGKDEHFLCCMDPHCRLCNVPTDIVAETYGGTTTNTIFEKRLTDDDVNAGGKKKH